MVEPKVSVIIPVYNSEKYLQQSIEGVLNQTLKEIEIICVDDGSTDNSLEILNKYKKRDKRVTVISQKNNFAGMARNNGMKLAKGKYLSFLDADDVFESTLLEEAYRHAEKVSADIVVFGGRYFEDDISKAYDNPSLLRMDMLSDNEVIEGKFDFLFNFTTPAPWNKIFKRQFVEENGLYFQKHKRINDAYFVEVALALAKRIGIVNKILINYRTGNNLSLQGTNNESPLLFYEVFRDIKDKLKESKNFDHNEKSFRNLCLSICIYNLESITQDKAYEKLYYALKEYIYEQLGIKDTKEEDYYNKYAYKQYQLIMELSLTGYLLKKSRNNSNYSANKEYLFPFGTIDKGSRIILYAAGRVGKAYYSQIQKTMYCIVVSWVDNNSSFYNNTKIKSPKDINMNDCDYIVIAIENESIARQIKESLIIDYRVEAHKIIWQQPIVKELNRWS